MPFKKGQSGNPSGRRKGAVSKERREVAEILAKHGGVEARVKKLIELGDGVTCVKYDKEGEATIYERPPDAYANSFLVEQVAGKAKQKIEMDVQAEVTWEDMFGVGSGSREGED